MVRRCILRGRTASDSPLVQWSRISARPFARPTRATSLTAVGDWSSGRGPGPVEGRSAGFALCAPSAAISGVSTISNEGDLVTRGAPRLSQEVDRRWDRTARRRKRVIPTPPRGAPFFRNRARGASPRGCGPLGRVRARRRPVPEAGPQDQESPGPSWSMVMVVGRCRSASLTASAAGGLAASIRAKGRGRCRRCGCRSSRRSHRAADRGRLARPAMATGSHGLQTSAVPRV